MTEQPENPGFILPIICPHCQKELNLSMNFELMPPEDNKENKPDDIIEEDKIS